MAQTPSEERAKKIELLRRLRNLSRDQSSPEEAAAAAAKFQELATKYAIELAEIDAASERGSEYIRRDHDWYEDAEAYWYGGVINTVAHYNMCQSVRTYGVADGPKPYQRCYTIIGEAHNIEIVDYLSEYVRTMILGQVRAYWYIHWGDNYMGSRVKMQAASKARSQYEREFKLGASAGICDKIKSAYEAAQAAAVSSTALMIVKDRELADAVAAHFPKLYHRRGAAINTNSAAYRDGVEAGRSIQLRPGVKGDQRKVHAIS